MKENKKQYLTPVVDLLDARVEKGFELSNGEDALSNTEEVTDSGRAYQWT